TKSELEKYVDYLASHPNTHVRIEGHADERGTTAYNLGLSKKRASAVANYLLDRGVAKNQIEVMSFGAQKPLASGNSEEAYAKNRRAEVQFEMNQDSAA
ncbi:MAG TPA: OmpA family protein, partial [Gammaproteobacteria bacterium]|nr:OmpA family protein [Gammaproteobacteria bacterium]